MVARVLQQFNYYREITPDLARQKPNIAAVGRLFRDELCEEDEYKLYVE